MQSHLTLPILCGFFSTLFENVVPELAIGSAV